MKNIALILGFMFLSYIGLFSQDETEKFVKDFKHAIEIKDTNQILEITNFPFYSYDEEKDVIDIQNLVSFKKTIVSYFFSQDFYYFIFRSARLQKASSELSSKTLLKINETDKKELLLLNFDFGSLVFKKIEGKIKMTAGIWIPIDKD